MLTRNEIFAHFKAPCLPRAQEILANLVAAGTVAQDRGLFALATWATPRSDPDRLRAREQRIAGLARDLFVQYWPLITGNDTDEELAENCFAAAEAFEALAEERLGTLGKKKSGAKKTS
jgi:hypothetical protein